MIPGVACPPLQVAPMLLAATLAVRVIPQPFFTAALSRSTLPSIGALSAAKQWHARRRPHLRTLLPELLCSCTTAPSFEAAAHYCWTNPKSGSLTARGGPLVRAAAAALLGSAEVSHKLRHLQLRAGVLSRPGVLLLVGALGAASPAVEVVLAYAQAHGAAVAQPWRIAKVRHPVGRVGRAHGGFVHTRTRTHACRSVTETACSGGFGCAKHTRTAHPNPHTRLL